MLNQLRFFLHTSPDLICKYSVSVNAHMCVYILHTKISFAFLKKNLRMWSVTKFVLDLKHRNRPLLNQSRKHLLVHFRLKFPVQILRKCVPKISSESLTGIQCFLHLSIPVIEPPLPPPKMMHFYYTLRLRGYIVILMSVRPSLPISNPLLL